MSRCLCSINSWNEIVENSNAFLVSYRAGVYRENVAMKLSALRNHLFIVQSAESALSREAKEESRWKAFLLRGRVGKAVSRLSYVEIDG